VAFNISGSLSQNIANPVHILNTVAWRAFQLSMLCNACITKATMLFKTGTIRFSYRLIQIVNEQKGNP
jgi:hypothetical protein